MSEQELTDLTKALGQATSIIGGVKSDQMGDATPCGQWDVKDLINHIMMATTGFGMVTRGEAVPAGTGDPTSVDYTSGDYTGTFATAKEELIAAWRAPGVWEREFAFPFATLPANAAARVELMEIVTHTWDLATATGQAAQLDDALAEKVLSFAPGMLPPEARNEQGDPFGPLIPEPNGASAYDRLAGFMGRQP